MTSSLAIQSLGDRAVLVTFGGKPSRDLALRVRRAAESIAAAALPGIVDLVQAYLTLAVFFDTDVITREALVSAIRELCATSRTEAASTTRMIDIPVRYDGPDLVSVAEQTGLSVADVIERHATPTYYAYMLGFVPGFAYLGDLDSALILPRLSVPRQRVPAGSVAIAGAQTAVYPLVTAGGWHLIGSTSLVMFDARQDPPARIRAGDSVRFVQARD